MIAAALGALLAIHLYLGYSVLRTYDALRERNMLSFATMDSATSEYNFQTFLTNSFSIEIEDISVSHDTVKDNLLDSIGKRDKLIIGDGNPKTGYFIFRSTPCLLCFPISIPDNKQWSRSGYIYNSYYVYTRYIQSGATSSNSPFCRESNTASVQGTIDCRMDEGVPYKAIPHDPSSIAFKGFHSGFCGFSGGIGQSIRSGNRLFHIDGLDCREILQPLSCQIESTRCQSQDNGERGNEYGGDGTDSPIMVIEEFSDDSRHRHIVSGVMFIVGAVAAVICAILAMWKMR